MSRNLPAPMVQSFTSNEVSPVVLLDLTLSGGVVAHVWSGVGTISYNGNSYIGVGSLGQVGDIKEGIEVRADGTSISLSGIDPNLLGECLADIQLGAPATISLGIVSNGQITASYPICVGTVDKPNIPVSPTTMTITLAIENRMINLQRPTMRRYTSADQQYYYPTDIGFNWVEVLADIALIWA